MSAVSSIRGVFGNVPALDWGTGVTIAHIIFYTIVISISVEKYQL